MSTEVFMAGMAAVLLAAVLIYAMTRIPKENAARGRDQYQSGADAQGARRK